MSGSSISLRIEKVSDVNAVYPYLEVFRNGAVSPFLEVGISEDKELVFKFYPSATEVNLTSVEWERILDEGRKFLPKAIADEAFFENSTLS